MITAILTCCRCSKNFHLVCVKKSIRCPFELSLIDSGQIKFHCTKCDLLREVYCHYLSLQAKKTYGVKEKIFSVKQLKILIKLGPDQKLKLRWANQLPKRVVNNFDKFCADEKCGLCRKNLKQAKNTKNQQKPSKVEATISDYGISFLNSRLPIGFKSTYKDIELFTVSSSDFLNILPKSKHKSRCQCICHQMLVEPENIDPENRVIYFFRTKGTCIECTNKTHQLYFPSNYYEKYLSKKLQDYQFQNYQDYNEIIFILRNKRTNYFYFADFKANSPVKIPKSIAQKEVQNCYRLLKNIDPEPLTYQTLGLRINTVHGCARTRAYNKEKYVKNICTSFERNLSPTELDETDATNDNDYFNPKRADKLSQFALPKKYEKMEDFRIGQSKIHGRGLIACRNYAIGEEVVEYSGERIRNVIADLREAEYRKNGEGNYLFALDNGYVIDATKFSSLARFINHSCEPNCVVTNVDDEKLVISTRKFIPAGEEFSFNYAQCAKI